MTRFKPPISDIKPAKVLVSQISKTRDNGVNLGNLYLPIRSVEDSPVFSQKESQKPFKDPTAEPLRTALVLLKVSGSEVNDDTLRSVGRTLAHLSRLGLSSIVVVDAGSWDAGSRQERRHRHVASLQADRVVAAIEKTRGARSRRLDGVVDVSPVKDDERAVVRLEGLAKVVHRGHLLKPLHRGVIPVIAPLAFDAARQTVVPIQASEIILALTRDLSEILPVSSIPEEIAQPVSLDRIIIIDSHGGIPSPKRSNGSHVFVNLEQEYENIKAELNSMASEASKESISSHLSNLRLARDTLLLLPPSSSAFITTPTTASTTGTTATASTPGVGTRSQRNPLIHNLLTDKPVFSSSLPLTRLTSSISTPAPSQPQPPTFLKRGMPITIFPDPLANPWMPPSQSSPPFSLSDSRLDLPRLIHLIEDSFGRTLDVPAYLARIAPRLAGIIVAGAYEGGAILTWETPPALEPSASGFKDASSPELSTEPSRLVPYLDKFAVLQRSQGAGGVADVVFNAMVRDCFPRGVAWRSRSSNPVNKWYFERARGSWKIPAEEGAQGWTMFWTTEDVCGERFSDYEGVCSSLGSNWVDGKKRLD